MFGFLSKIGKAYSLVGKIKTAIDEGKDVAEAITTMRNKYADLDDDAKAAWDEVDEFLDSVRAIF
jgi:hypothetical protein|tara:strand:- start:566 stop:760 length:195 start_codon:yes stop_codon:yes gene_type:complete